MPKIEAYMAKKIAAGKNNNCTLENAGVRREWYVRVANLKTSTSEHPND